MALLVLLVLIIIGAVFYGLYIAHQALTVPERTLCRQARKMAKEAAAAASVGNYAERDRLDHARNAILASLNKSEFVPFQGSDHDDWSQKYLP